MRKYIYGGYLGLVVLASCENNSLISEELLADENFQVSTIRDVEIELFTARFDSMITSNTGQVLIGKSRHGDAGIVASRAYFIPGLDFSSGSYDDLDAEHFEFDSLTLVLQSNGRQFFEEEEEILLQYNIYQLSSELEALSTGSLYNTSAAPETGPQVGTLSFYTGLEDGDEIEVRLSDSLGLDMFERMVNQDEIFNTSTNFMEYIKGFEIGLDSAGQLPFMAFYGDSLMIRLYYTNKSSLPEKQNHFDFSAKETLYYSYVERLQADEALSELKKNEDRVSAEKTGGYAYVCGGANYATVVSFPSIRDLLLEEKTYVLSGAVLRIYPAEGSDFEANAFPETLDVYAVDGANNFLSSSPDFQATLSYDEDFGRDTYYDIDITSFVLTLLESYTIHDYALFLTIPTSEIATTGYGVALEDGSGRSELILYTITHK